MLAALPASTLAELLESQCVAGGNRIAYSVLRDDLLLADSLTYAELRYQCRLLAVQLEVHTRPGDRVLLALPPGIDFVRTFWACMLAGRVAVPVPPPDPIRLLHAAPRLRGIVDDAGARLGFIGESMRQAVQDILGADGPTGMRWMTPAELQQTEVTGASAPAIATKVDPGTLAYLQYTSGSTAAARGVCLTHGNALANARALVERARMGPDSRLLCWLPTFHDYGLVFGLLLPLVAGASGWLMSPLSFLRRPLRWFDAIGTFGITHTGAPDSAYATCLRHLADKPYQGDLSSLVSLSCGAEPIQATTVESLLQACVTAGLRPEAFMPAYGLAESVLGVSAGSLDVPPRLLRVDAAAVQAHQVRRPASADTPVRVLVGCGQPLAGTDVAIVDPETCVQRAGDAVGEIWVRSAGVGTGYWRQPEVSRDCFGAVLADGSGPWLRTGDLGFLDENELFVTGRLKDMLIVHGTNHYPQDVERTAEQAHAAARVGHAATFGVETDRGEGVVVLVEIERRANISDATAMARAVRRAVAQSHDLALEAVGIVRAGTLPRTSSGKIQRQRCRMAYLAGELQMLVLARNGMTSDGAPDATRVMPRNAAEQALWDIWCEVLHHAAFGVHERFVDLGGNSLMMTQVASRLRERSHVELPLEAMFQHASIAALAERLAESLRDPAASHAALIIPAAPRDVPLPVSLSQRRMWLIQQFDPKSVAYNVAVPLRLRGAFDHALLQRALDVLVARHEGLRTSFAMQGAEPVQVIESVLHLPVDLIDLRALLVGDRMAAARDLLRDRVATPFDLTRAPLHRVTLVRLDDDDHVLLWLMHHAITDNWSVTILLRELLALYAAWQAGETHSLPPLALPFRDYAAWQRSPTAVAQRQQQMQYWVARLQGLGRLTLPTDFPRPPHPTFRGAQVSAKLPERLRSALRAFCGQQGVTPFVVFLSAFKLLLARHAASEDIAVGTPIANRHLLATESLVGTLVNTLVLRTDLSGDLNFIALVERVRSTALDAFAHQDAPFDELVETLAHNRMAHPEGLVNVLFNVLNAPLGRFEPVTFGYEEFEIERTAAQFDLSMHIDTEFGHRIHLDYSTDLYAAVSAERLLENYLALIERLLAEPARPLSAFGIVAPSQLALIQNEWNATQSPLPGEALAHRCLQTAHVASHDTVAVVDASGARMAYGELDARSNAMANLLRARGIGRGHRVGLCVERDAGMLVALLGVLKSGAAYVPLDPGFPVDRLAYMASDAGLSVIVASAALAAIFADVDATVLDPDDPALDAAGLRAPVPADAERDARPGDAAYLIYTSGSTGRPKGVAVPHRAVVNFLIAMVQAPGLSGTDRLVAVTTLSFDIAVLELLLPLAVGAQVIVASRDQVDDPLQLRGLLEQHGATVMQATPSAWSALIATGWTGGAGFRALIGGEPLPVALAEQLMARTDALWNMYGPTETTVWSTCWRVQSPRDGISIGRPIANTSVWVLDPLGHPCPIGVPGEACIGGEGVTLGYHERPALTAERFAPDPRSDRPDARFYRTGDRVRWRHDGLLEHLGRLDHQVKVRGFRIELGEIEAVLLDHPSVAHCVVVTHARNEDDVRLAAYVVLHSGEPGTGPLREDLRTRLPGYMLPQYLMSLPALPLLPNGKIDRNALPAPEIDPERSAAHAWQPPVTREEKVIAEIWGKLLEVDRISGTDNFFDLGGHSLLAMRAVAEINRQLGGHIAPRRFVFETLRQLALPAYFENAAPQTPGFFSALKRARRSARR